MAIDRIDAKTIIVTVVASIIVLLFVIGCKDIFYFILVQIFSKKSCVIKSKSVTLWSETNNKTIMATLQQLLPLIAFAVFSYLCIYLFNKQNKEDAKKE